ncbi:MAG: hypothetical protein ACRDYA_07095 [Egibacteraceae bacterium]
MPLDGTPLAEGLRNFFGPLAFILLAIVALSQLVKLKGVAVFNLVLAGIVLAILLYRPDVIIGLGHEIANLLPGSGSAPG